MDDADQFARVGRIPDDADAFAGDLGDQRVDVALGADIDAARDVVEQQDGRLGQQPFLEQHLLLVAAAEIARSARAPPRVRIWARAMARADELALARGSRMTEDGSQPVENGVGHVVGRRSCAAAGPRSCAPAARRRGRRAIAAARRQPVERRAADVDRAAAESDGRRTAPRAGCPGPGRPGRRGRGFRPS